MTIRLTPHEGDVVGEVLGNWLERYGHPKPGHPLEKINEKRVEEIRELKASTIPYLPGTDIMITCEFEERKREEKIWKGVLRDTEAGKPIDLEWHHIQAKPHAKRVKFPSFCNCGIGYIVDIPQPKPQSKKLITLDVLKERGVSCKWALDWFESHFWKGVTFINLLQSIRKSIDLSTERQIEALYWVIDNLLDFA